TCALPICQWQTRISRRRDARERGLWPSLAEQLLQLRFVVDGMLGGLARWLRMLGYETEYDSKADDNTLLELSKKQEAILLTRDEELYNLAVAKTINLVVGTGEKDT